MSTTEVGLFLACGYLLARGIVSVASKMLPPEPSRKQTVGNAKMKPAALIAASVAATQRERAKNDEAEKAMHEAETATKERIEADKATAHALAKLPEGTPGFAVVEKTGAVSIYQTSTTDPRGYTVLSPAFGDLEVPDDPAEDPAPAVST